MEMRLEHTKEQSQFQGQKQWRSDRRNIGNLLLFQDTWQKQIMLEEAFL